MKEYIEKNAVVVDDEFDEFFIALVNNDLSLARLIIEEIKNHRKPRS